MTQKKPERTLELHVDIDAPIEAAWKAITEGPGIANWFAPVAEVSAPGKGEGRDMARVRAWLAPGGRRMWATITTG